MVETRPEPFLKDSTLKNKFLHYLKDKSFPCIGAKASIGKEQLKVFTAGSVCCPYDDQSILRFMYDFIDIYRMEGNGYHSAAILFTDTQKFTEDHFEKFMWERLQALSDLDALNYSYDNRVSSDTTSPDFSFSLKEESFFIISMHPGSSREARSFSSPVLVFNPHQQFEKMRKTGKYDQVKKVVRRNDLVRNGSINPMLNDHGKTSEVWQYSGKNYSELTGCPFKSKHATN